MLRGGVILRHIGYNHLRKYVQTTGCLFATKNDFINFGYIGHVHWTGHQSSGRQTVWAADEWATNLSGDSQLGDTFWSTGRRQE